MKNETQMGKLTPSTGQMLGKVTVVPKASFSWYRCAQTVLGQTVQYTFKGTNI